MPLNPPLSYTPQKQRQPENIIPKDSDSIPLGRDIIFTFANLPDSGPANPFTLKEKSQKSPALQEDGRNGRDDDLPDSDDPDSDNFNDDDNDNDKVDDHLGDINKQVLTWDIITAISALANTIKC